MDDRWGWFYPYGYDADMFPLIFSPMMAVVGPWEEAQIEPESRENRLSNESAFIRAYDQSSYDKDADIEAAAAKLRELFSGLGKPFSQINHEDTSAIALVLKQCFYRCDAAGD